jgi:hypothetical protein
MTVVAAALIDLDQASPIVQKLGLVYLTVVGACWANCYVALMALALVIQV